VERPRSHLHALLAQHPLLQQRDQLWWELWENWAVHPHRGSCEKPNPSTEMLHSLKGSLRKHCSFPDKQIPRGDPRLPTGPDSCIPSFRSAPVCGTGNSAFNFGGEPNQREQINALTAFLDLSQVYGSDEKLALFLRDLENDGGLLRVNAEFRDNRRELLPFSPLQANICATRKRVTNDTNAREVPCFIAGESSRKFTGTISFVNGILIIYWILKDQ